MNRFPLVLAAAGALGLLSAQAMAELSSADKTFLDKAAQGGLAEVQLGQLAEQKAASPKVKQFGERMVTDHSKANQDLRQVAKQMNVTLPAQPSAEDLATARKLRSESGANFDEAYMKDMVSDHRQDIAGFKKEAQSGQDPAVKGFAQKYVPVLEQHLSLAEAAEPKK
jgi:putative membrane protein